MPTAIKILGDRPCLDFVNTTGGWIGAAVINDKLIRYDDLVRWAELAGVIPAEQARVLARRSRRHPAEAGQVLRRAIALRRAVREMFRAVLGQRKPKPADTAAFERELAIARSHQRLKHRGGRFEWSWDDRESALDSMLWAVSSSAADLLTSPDLSHVRQCGGETCGWMFLDRSRNHSRQWCDMGDCGNRAKVRRYRQRQRAT